MVGLGLAAMLVTAGLCPTDCVLAVGPDTAGGCTVRGAATLTSALSPPSRFAELSLLSEASLVSELSDPSLSSALSDPSPLSELSDPSLLSELSDASVLSALS